MKANDFVKLVFGYFADNPDAGLDFIEHIENRAEQAASVQEDGNVWGGRSVVKADIIQHCGSNELPVARIVDDKPGDPIEWPKGSIMESWEKSHLPFDAEQPKKKKSGKRARVPKRASEKQDVDKTKSKPDSLDKRMEDAYMGEHVNIEPEQPEQKPLSPKEHDFYNYILAHPDAKMPRVCADLHLSMAMYYYLKSQIKKKGYNIQGVVDFNVVEEKPEPGIL